MWPFSKKEQVQERIAPTFERAPNPHANMKPNHKRSFYSTDVGRILGGWTSESNSIDTYLKSELRSLRARSRENVRKNPYGKKLKNLIKTNIVGPAGVVIQAQSRRMVNGRMELDELANQAIEAAFKEWCDFYSDYSGMQSFVDMQYMAAMTAAQDGEMLFRIHEGRSAGKYGIQLEEVDPELLDIMKNQKTKSGEIRLGVEYDARKRPIRYWFREKDENGNYNSGRTYSVSAINIIHIYMKEWPDQSRGIPWAHAVIERLKNMDKYDEAAMVAARYGASKALFLASRDDPTNPYTGDEDGSGLYEGATLENVEPGSITDIGNRELVEYDPKYPHEMYSDYSKSTLRAISSGAGVSYHAVSNDLADVNYSSIRAGVLEDREFYKIIQNWLIRAFIRPIYERWLTNAVLSGAILVGSRPLARPITEYMPATYQARRWQWVDPAKEVKASIEQIKERLKSRSQIMRDQGDDPETVWAELERENRILKERGLLNDGQQQEN